jgi:hypothetical protein
MLWILLECSVLQEMLDASTGTVPAIFAELQWLEILNISVNSLTGKLELHGPHSTRFCLPDTPFIAHLHKGIELMS